MTTMTSPVITSTLTPAQDASLLDRLAILTDKYTEQKRIRDTAAEQVREASEQMMEILEALGQDSVRASNGAKVTKVTATYEKFDRAAAYAKAPKFVERWERWSAKFKLRTNKAPYVKVS